MLVCKSSVENEWEAHGYILAIQFYLGYFETNDGRILKNQYACKMLAQIQQS